MWYIGLHTASQPDGTVGRVGIGGIIGGIGGRVGIGAIALTAGTAGSWELDDPSDKSARALTTARALSTRVLYSASARSTGWEPELTCRYSSQPEHRNNPQSEQRGQSPSGKGKPQSQQQTMRRSESQTTRRSESSQLVCGTGEERRSTVI